MNAERNTLPAGVVVLAVALTLLALPALAAPPGPAPDADAVARGLVAWLGGGASGPPAGALPDRGTISFGLRSLGTARSAVGSGQARAILDALRDALHGHRVSVAAVDARDSAWAWVRARVEDRDGGPVAVLLLALHAEDGRWVLRELRETSP